jgi:lipoate-protein ligase B
MNETSRAPTNEIWVCHLGTVPYQRAVAIQEAVRARRLAGELPDVLLMLEHPPAYTRGRRSSAQELPFPAAFYAAKGIELHETDRGGRITYHGPGQLVGYPIIELTDVHLHLRRMEDAVIDAIGAVGVRGRSRREEGVDYTGVWVQDRKIASIGVHVSRGISTHGFAVNVENDLEPFSWVVACGLPDVRMTSLALEAPAPAEGIRCFRKRMAHSFCEAHGARQRLVSPARLGIATADPSRPAAGRAPVKTSSLLEPVPA